MGSAWNFYGQSGLSKNWTVFTWANPNAPLGDQVLFLQNQGYVETDFFFNAGYYRFRFKAAWREGCCGKEKFIRVLVDGVEAGEIQLRSKNYEEYVTLPLYLTSGTHTIRLEGDNPVPGGDFTGFIDDFGIQNVWALPNYTNWTVPAGSVYVITSTHYNWNKLKVHGTLVAPQNRNVTIDANYILVEGNGRFQIGQELSPYPMEANITLKGTDPTQHDHMGTKFLGAMGSGVIELHGEEKVSWTQLSSTANTGDSQISVEDSVDWNNGDEIIIAPSGTSWNQYEKRTIASIAGNKKDITLTSALSHKHIGATKSYSANSQNWTVDMRAEVGLLTRNIKIQGDAVSSSTRFGAHMMIMGNAQAFINGVELYRVGQEKITGRYPFHWHHRHNADGQYFKNSSVHTSYNRALTIHRTNNTLVQNSVFFDHVGHGIFFEEGNEEGNQILGNLVIGSKRPTPAQALTTSETINEIQNRSPASYWITHPNNTIEGNVAAGTKGTGFWYIFPEDDLGGQGVDPQTAPFGSFNNNVAHSCSNGFDIYDLLRVDESVRKNVGYFNPAIFRIRNSTWYSNNVGIYTGTGSNIRSKNEYNREVFVPTDNLIFENNIFAENKRSVMLASQNNIENSIFIAHTGLGNPTINNQSLIHMYDGAGNVSNSHIVGYDSSSSHMTSFAGATITYGNFRFNDVTKANSLVFKASQGTINSELRRNATIYDQDGSLSGYPDNTLVINHPFMLFGDEDSPSQWTNFKRSTRRYVNTRAFYHLDDAPWSGSFRFPHVRVTRTKTGTTTQSVLYNYNRTREPILPFVVNDLNVLYTYDLTPQGQTLSSILPSQKSIIGFMLLNTVAQNDFVIVRFEELGSLAGLYVDMNSDDGVFNNQTNTSVDQKYSLTDLKNHQSSAYFIDGSDLYIKAVATGDFSQVFNIKWGLIGRQTSTNLNEIKEEKLSDDVADVLYPNPVSSKLFVKGLSGGEALQVIDARGRLILSTTYKNSLDVSQLKSGMYILRVNDKSYRFIKE